MPPETASSTQPTPPNAQAPARKQQKTYREVPIGTPLLVELEVSGLGTSNAGASTTNTESQTVAGPTAAGVAFRMHWVTLSSDQFVAFNLGTSRSTTAVDPAEFAAVVLNPQALNFRYDVKVARRHQAWQRYAAKAAQSPFSLGSHPTMGLTKLDWVHKGAGPNGTDNSGGFWMIDTTIPLMIAWDLAINAQNSTSPWATTFTKKEQLDNADVSIRAELGLSARLALGQNERFFNDALGLQPQDSRGYWGPSFTFAAHANQVDFFATWTRFGKGERVEVPGLTGSQVIVGAQVTGTLWEIRHLSKEQTEKLLQKDGCNRKKIKGSEFCKE